MHVYEPPSIASYAPTVLLHVARALQMSLASAHPWTIRREGPPLGLGWQDGRRRSLIPNCFDVRARTRAACARHDGSATLRSALPRDSIEPVEAHIASTLPWHAARTASSAARACSTCHNLRWQQQPQSSGNGRQQSKAEAGQSRRTHPRSRCCGKESLAPCERTRFSTKSYYKHWEQRLSKAAVLFDAAAISKQVIIMGKKVLVAAHSSWG